LKCVVTVVLGAALLAFINGLVCCVAVVGPRGILMSYSMNFWGTLVLENSNELICETNKTRGTCVISRLCYSYLETRDSRVF
jgi:hypothetical protein